MKRINTATYQFDVIRNNGLLYVDKTAYLYDLASMPNGQYFCSRPRRFGKSLAVNTFEAIFQGRCELFDGLFIAGTDYDWKKYPVVHIDFTDCGKDNPEDLAAWLCGRLDSIASSFRVDLAPWDSPDDKFSHLIDGLALKGTQVVVLVDEYEKVISDHLDAPRVGEMRDVLEKFYQVIKAKERQLRFTFVTGVTKYTKMSVFSKLNNLTDITMHPRYAAMFGYTQQEVEDNFKDYIDLGLRHTGMRRDAYLAKLKWKYDGYCFNPGSETVYNPVSVGNFFDAGGESFDNYWTETGNTRLVMEVAKKTDFDLPGDLDEPVDKLALGTFDILSLSQEHVTKFQFKSLLQETGYLTISPRTPRGSQNIWLDFPNDEVRGAFSTHFLALRGMGNADDLSVLRNGIMDSAAKGDVEQLAQCLQSLFAMVPYQLHLKDEHYYQTIFYTFMLSLGAKVEVEKSVSGGSIDAVLDMPGHLYIIEFKRDKDAATAMNQILQKDYPASWEYLKKHKHLHAIGINVDTVGRKVTAQEETLE